PAVCVSDLVRGFSAKAAQRRFVLVVILSAGDIGNVRPLVLEEPGKPRKRRGRLKVRRGPLDRSHLSFRKRPLCVSELSMTSDLLAQRLPYLGSLIVRQVACLTHRIETSERRGARPRWDVIDLVD